ncbi:MAG: hypothetical protein ACYCWK_05995 [Cuniculiplasma sp.]
MKQGEQYKEIIRFPFGFRSYSLPNRHEMALKFDNYLIVDDSVYGINGRLGFYPYDICPDRRMKGPCHFRSVDPYS